MFADENDDPIVRRLEAMPRLEPPPDLRPSVMEAIHRLPRVVQASGLPLGGGAGQRPAPHHRPNGGRRSWFVAAWAAAAAFILLFLVVVRPKDHTVPATLAPDAVTVRISPARLEIVARHAVSVSLHADPKAVLSVDVSGVSDPSFPHKHQANFRLQPAQRAIVVLRARGDAVSAPVVVSANGDEVIHADVPLK